MGAISAEDLLALLDRHAAHDWLAAVVAGDVIATDVGLRTTYARARRLFGDSPLGPGSPPSLLRWTAADAACCTVLLAACARLPAVQHVPATKRLLHSGELGEQVALLRSLALLPEPQRFVEVACEAARTNVVPVFEALACENEFPMAYLPDDAVRQLVLKAIFLGVAAGRIIGLARRVDAELVRMLDDYAAERRAAGRSVPDDIALVTGTREGCS